MPSTRIANRPEADQEEMVKAIYDLLSEELSSDVKELVGAEATRLEESLAARCEKMSREWGELHAKFLEEHERLNKAYRKQQDREIDRFTTLVKSLQPGPGQGLTADSGYDIVMSVSKSLDDRFEKRLLELEGWVREQVTSLKAHHIEGLEAIKDVLKSLPPPVANVTLPEIRPQIHNEVRVPESPPAQITLQAPPAKPTRKHITYDDVGRPVEIVEQEVSE